MNPSRDPPEPVASRTFCHGGLGVLTVSRVDGGPGPERRWEVRLLGSVGQPPGVQLLCSATWHATREGARADFQVRQRALFALGYARAD